MTNWIILVFNRTKPNQRKTEPNQSNILWIGFRFNFFRISVFGSVRFFRFGSILTQCSPLTMALLSTTKTEAKNMEDLRKLTRKLDHICEPIQVTYKHLTKR